MSTTIEHNIEHKPPYLILILDSDGQVVCNALCSEFKLEWPPPFPIWENFQDWLDNPLGTMMQNPYVTLTFKSVQRKEKS